ncbi:MAG: RNA polymerase sigma factor [Candidatus Binatia bacterium]|nr:MAG: RNA polymerase sigma factor [Candidatus Binatia bacterium]
MERSDAELVELARKGDKDAFRELFERYQKKVTSIALGMVNNPEDAMEIVQDTFVKAYENLEGFKGESSFYTWLFRITVNRAIDLRRHQRRNPTVGLQEEFGFPDSDEPYDEFLGDAEGRTDPVRQAESREIGSRVAEAISELTPYHRAVILLREVEGLSYEEISRVMQCSKGTVMSRLHYARKKLQSKLKDLL